MTSPADLGYDSADFELPPLTYHDHFVEDPCPGELFPGAARRTLSEQRSARRRTLESRVRLAADLCNSSREQWVVWCELNDEAALAASLIDGAVNVQGSDDIEAKESAFLGFASRSVRVLVTKPRIGGFGMNWQNCARTVFVGLWHSFEQSYQCVRRFWRYGQSRPVEVHRIAASSDKDILENVTRKAREAANLTARICERITSVSDIKSSKAVARTDVQESDECVDEDGQWTMVLGDSAEVLSGPAVADDSCGLAIFSPPFPGMYVYTDSPRDVGNCADIDELVAHMDYVVGGKALFRAMAPGRSAFVHLTQYVATKPRDGFTGLRDFRGKVIDQMCGHGWIYYGEIVVDKNPQVKAIRTKDHGLMFKSLATDSAKMHPALADYVLQFRKPGDNARPIRSGKSKRYDNPDGWVTNEEWIRWAHPVWYDIKETDVLNVAQARDDKDERHLCPLQIPLIERIVKIWSAPGELVISPFAGIGSEGVAAVRHGRRFLGIELKRSYYEAARRNLETAVAVSRQGKLFP